MFTDTRSSCHAVGFFELVGDYRYRYYHPPLGPNPPSSEYTPLATYAHYRSRICSDDSALLPVSIRAPLPVRNGIVSEGAIVYAVGDVFVRRGTRTTLIDACKLKVLPFPPSTRFPGCYMDVQGQVACERRILPDETVVVIVDVSQYVRNGENSFQVGFVFSPNTVFNKC